MTAATAITGEASSSKLAAVFRDPSAARAAAQAVAAELALAPEQVNVITPSEPHAGRKLEPEEGGIWHTLLRAHLRLGVVGSTAGLLLFAVLFGLGVQLIVSAPILSAVVLLFFGAMAGLMLGGLVTLRPDHDRYIDAARHAMAHGETTVVVHAFSSAQRERAAELLQRQGGKVTSTL